MNDSLDSQGQISQISSAEDAFRVERDAYERLEKDLRCHKDAIRCAYQNLEREANKTWPSVLAIRAALQALKPYL